VTPVDIADYAAEALTNLEVDVIDMLRTSDEFGQVFDKLADWVLTINVSRSEWSPLAVTWRRYLNDGVVSFVLHVGFPVWAHVEKGDMAGIEAWIPNGTEMRWPDIAAAVDAALAEFEKLKEGINV
jgi:hypothetical protein